MAIHTFPKKDPGDRLDYTLDFTNLLETAELFASLNSVVIAPTTVPALVVEASGLSLDFKKVTVVLSGGLAGTTYSVTVNATTDTGSPARIFERTCLVPVKDV